ncbi:armadillo-like helical domain-containing protein 2 [Trachemys scripta elegans]|uniref:armadillo-like helical domain-containing protein 2 n=1 Tax=Trachemys scripta elegans TaxID=31138 RepID=UPI001556AF2E|nr:armadillo-like helical domain-containing protein 2 [Trachemys scripta elegans]
MYYHEGVTESMFKKLQACYETYIKTFFSSVKEEPYNPTGTMFHKQKIVRYGTNLRNTQLPLEQRAEAAKNIGLLAYTGGPNAGMHAAEYIQDLIDILHMPDTSANVRILVLQGLCGICYINYSNQNKVKDLNLAEVLLVCLIEDENSSPASNHITMVKFWVCYLLTVLCCNNIPYIRIFQELGGQLLETKLKILSSMEWSGWPDNYAEVLFSFLGFYKGQLTSGI